MKALQLLRAKIKASLIEKNTKRFNNSQFEFACY